MPFDGSGNFNRTFPPGGWTGDAAAGFLIEAPRHDTHDKDLADGLSNCITKDGQTQPIADIPMNNHRITHLAEPVADDDAATLKTIKTIGEWTTSKTISGAELNGRLVFSGTGGVGLQFTVADLSWLARIGEASKTTSRLVLNDTAAGATTPGGDVATLDVYGNLNLNGSLTYNLSWADSGTAGWKTVVPGLGTRLMIDGIGAHWQGLDAATTLDNYKPAPLREWGSFYNTGGNVIHILNKGIGAVYNAIYANMNGAYRWVMYLGTNAAESGNAGSNYELYSFDNDGTAHLAMSIARLDRATSIPGLLTLGGGLNVGASFSVSGASCTSGNFVATSGVYAGSGAIISFRPNLATTTGLASINAAGDLTIDRYLTGKGVEERNGTAGSNGGQYINFDYLGGPLHAWVNTADLGVVAFTCDYRLKKDIQPLERTWDKVKALRPISFTRRNWVINEGQGPGIETRLSTNTDEPEWGFLAHELQETLLPSAANGHKDQENVVQSPNLPAIIAALTSALQEAMARIEALEAAA